MEVKILNEFVGKKVESIVGMEKDSDTITFKFADGSAYEMYHDQDCCEQVWLEDVDGDVSDLIGQTLSMAEETIEYPEVELHNDSETWTYYKFATVKGYVNLRWIGASNGYYSESVDIRKLS